MFFAIDPHNGVAIYDQIVRQVTFAVANGAIRPGDMVPSVRELSKQLAVNPNTVARAFQELQRSGVVSSVRGTGMEVTTAAPDQCRTERERLLRLRLTGVLQEALRSGLPPPGVLEIVREELARLTAAAPINTPAGGGTTPTTDSPSIHPISNPSAEVTS
jgi:GntR family transcriptional regulator